MSGLLAILLKLLPLLAPLWPIIQAILNQFTAQQSGGVGMNSDYLTYVVGQGAGGGLAAFGTAKWVEAWGLAKIAEGEIGYRLRKAASLDSKSSDREIEKAIDTLKKD
jgi:hypothetical protein